jgi:hypothetical protein
MQDAEGTFQTRFEVRGDWVYTLTHEPPPTTTNPALERLTMENESENRAPDPRTREVAIPPQILMDEEEYDRGDPPAEAKAVTVSARHEAEPSARLLIRNDGGERQMKQRIAERLEIQRSGW